MRPAFLKAACCLALALTGALCARPGDDQARVRLRLLDAASGQARAGLVRILPGAGGPPLALPGLFDRLRGLERSEGVSGWYVVPAAGADVALPRGRLRVEALAGLETALARQDLDLTASVPETVAVRLTPVFDPASLGLAAGNTHLHLRKLTREQADDYLRQVPAADGLRVLFVSYLERHRDDVDYSTNRYPVGDLPQFQAAGVLLNNGEEHRHNFDAYGQGYGHVMFLGIRNLVRPVSLGPGITGAGDDDRPLRPGMDEARGQGGTVLWCHNASGFEGVPSALAGRFDALNLFDGSRTGTVEEKYYRYLNVGVRMPLSTGTDWFVYDFSRVYAKVEGRLTVPAWLEALRAGRAVATNGPLLTLRVDGREPGDTLRLDQPGSVRVEAAGLGRHDFQRLELVQNGKVVAAQPAEKRGNRFEARLDRAVRIESPGWLAVRIASTTKNELGHALYAHASPVYVDLAGRRVFEVDAAQALLRQAEEDAAQVQARGRFSSAAARDRVLALYGAAADDLRRRINRRQP